jgi:nitrilase
MTMPKVAVVQAAPVLFDLEGSLEKVRHWTALAAGEGATLVLFPEVFLSGYPRGLSFGTVVGSRSAEGRADWLHYYKSAVKVPGPATDILADIARNFRVTLVIGVTETGESGGTLFCTLLYFGPDGQLLHRHRKIKPTAAERIIWGEGQGDDLLVLDTPSGRLGGLICWENYMPLARMALYEQGIQVYLAPTADQRESWQATIRHIACEGRCFVLSANQFVQKNMYPERFQNELEGQPNILSRGGSAIISPMGEILAGPLWDQEGLLTAQIDLEEVIKSRMDFDVAGHYQRPDIFSFSWTKNSSSFPLR